MNKFNYSTKNTNQLNDGSMDLFVRSLRIRDLDPNVIVHTDSTNRLIAVNDVQTDNKIVFNEDGYGDYKSVGWNNGTKTADITTSGTDHNTVSKPTNTLRSYAYSEGTYDASHRDWEIKCVLKSVPENDVRLVFSTFKNIGISTSLSEWGNTVIMFHLGSGIRQVQTQDLFNASNTFAHNYTTGGVALNDTFELKCQNGIIKMYYKGLPIASVPDFPIEKGDKLYVGVVDSSTASGAFSIEATAKDRARTSSIKTVDGQLKVSNSAETDLLTISEVDTHIYSKLSQQFTHRQTFNTTNHTETLPNKYNFVICDTSANGSVCRLNLPLLSGITNSYMLYITNLGTTPQDVRIYPSGSDLIDGTGVASYINLPNAYDNCVLLCSVESNGTKQWFLMT